MIEPLALTCPACHEPPLIASPAQAWCGNDGCPVVMWIPQRSPARSFDDLHLIDLPPGLGTPDA